MSEQTRSLEEIEQDIRSTRADIDQTLDALQSKLSPGQLLDRALGYARDGGGQFAANLGRNVRDSPLPLLLTGAGIAWLMIASGRQRKKDANGFGEAVGDEAHDRRAGTQSADLASMGAAAQSASVGGGATSYQTDTPGAPEHLSGARRPTEERSSTARERLSGAAESTREQAAELGAGAKEKLHEARERGGDYLRRARQQGASTASAAGRFLTDHPLVAGTLGLALGAAIATVLPSTRREGEWFGEQSDKFKRAARRAGERNAEEAKDVAKAAFQGAKTEAERQHLTPEDSKREAGHLAQAGADAVSSARRAGEAKAREAGGEAGAAAGDEGKPGESRQPGPARKG